MGMNMVNNTADWHTRLLTAGFQDDFVGLGDRWNTLVADAGSSVAEDADDMNGVVNITTGATNNNEAYLFTNSIYRWLTDKPAVIQARFQFTEANVDDANVIFGIGETFGAANTLLDDGGGPPASYHGCCFYKVDGGTRWQFEVSVGAVQTTYDLGAAAGGASFVTMELGMEILGDGSLQVIPRIDLLGGNNLNQPYLNSAGIRPFPVRANVPIATTAVMALCLGAKAGAANSEVLKVDLAGIEMRR